MKSSKLNQAFNLPTSSRVPLWEKSRGSNALNQEMLNDPKLNGLWNRARKFKR